MNKYLCIGGENDGQFFEGNLQGKEEWHLRNFRKGLAVTDSAPDMDMVESYSAYRVWTFQDRRASQKFSLLIEISIPDKDIMPRLILGYTAAQARREGTEE